MLISDNKPMQREPVVSKLTV